MFFGSMLDVKACCITLDRRRVVLIGYRVRHSHELNKSDVDRLIDPGLHSTIVLQTCARSPSRNLPLGVRCSVRV